MAIHPQVELYTQKVEAFMGKYPKVTGKGASDAICIRNVRCNAMRYYNAMRRCGAS